MMTEIAPFNKDAESARRTPFVISMLRGLATGPLVTVDFMIIFELTSSYIEKRAPHINELGVLATATFSAATDYCASRLEEFHEQLARDHGAPEFAPNTTIPSPTDQSGIASFSPPS